MQTMRGWCHRVGLPKFGLTVSEKKAEAMHLCSDPSTALSAL